MDQVIIAILTELLKFQFLFPNIMTHFKVFLSCFRVQNVRKMAVEVATGENRI